MDTRHFLLNIVFTSQCCTAEMRFDCCGFRVFMGIWPRGVGPVGPSQGFRCYWCIRSLDEALKAEQTIVDAKGVKT